MENTNNPPKQNQQNSPRAVFATRPHPSCCIFSYNTRNRALTSIYSILHWRIKGQKCTLLSTSQTKS